MLAYWPGLAFWRRDLSTSAGHERAVAKAPENKPLVNWSGSPPIPQGFMIGSSRCFAWKKPRIRKHEREKEREKERKGERERKIKEKE